MDRQMDRQTDRWIDRQVDGQMDGQKAMLDGKLEHGKMDRWFDGIPERR